MNAPHARVAARRAGLVMLTVTAGLLLTAAAPASAAPTTVASRMVSAPTPAPTADLSAPSAPTVPTDPSTPAAKSTGNAPMSLDLNTDSLTKPSSSLVIMLGLTVMSVAPALLLMMTSFTKVFVVLSLTRNAIGLQNVPPNQVLAGLALFLSLFIMGPTISAVNTSAVQPYVHGDITFSQALDAGSGPMRTFMLKDTRQADIALITRAANRPNPPSADQTPMMTLVPAFVLSELRSAFIIGFVIFIPFLIIDLVVSSSLMAMGMMMLPPVMVSLPFKLLLFVLVDGWGLILTSLIGSYR